MKRRWTLLALGVSAYIIFALVTLPASVVLSRLGSSGISAAGVSGTIWNGRAQVLQVQGTNIGGVEWRLHPLPLFAARVSADVKVSRLDGFATTKISVSPGGVVALRDLTASVPLSALQVSAIPRGWSATLNGRFAQLELEDGWPTRVEGTLDIVDLTGPARNPMQAGSYRLAFDPAASNAEVLKSAIADAGDGPLEVTGAFQLKRDRSYELEVLVAPRPNAPRDLLQALEFLGPPDAQGRRQFGSEGTI
jgi:general secretion pathway protein N